MNKVCFFLTMVILFVFGSCKNDNYGNINLQQTNRQFPIR